MFISLGLPPLGTQGWRDLTTFAHEHTVMFASEVAVICFVLVAFGFCADRKERRRLSGETH